MRNYLFSVVLANLVMIFPMTASAQVAEAEFNGLSAWELTLGEAVQTDCKIELTSQSIYFKFHGKPTSSRHGLRFLSN